MNATDGQTPRHGTVALCTASRGEKEPLYFIA